MKLLASNGERHHKEKEMFSVPHSDVIERNHEQSGKRRSSGSEKEVAANKTRKRKISTGEDCSDTNKGKKASKKTERNEDSEAMNVLHRIFRSNSVDKMDKQPAKETEVSCHQIFFLKPKGENANLAADRKKPITVDHIQRLVLASVAGKSSPIDLDEWCELKNPEQISQTVFLTLNGLSAFHVLCHESLLTETNKIFKTKLEVKGLKAKNDFFTRYLLPEVSFSTKEMLLMEHGNLKAVAEEGKGNFVFAYNSSESENDTENESLPEGDKFSRTKLLLSALQMIEENYPWPYKNNFTEMYNNYINTKDKYEPVTGRSPLYAIDCEMCRTKTSAQELTRISIVNENMECVYESLVRPRNEIIDFLTQYSGITPEMMLKATKMLPQVQSEIREILPPDAILVGQSLNFDLHALKMMHPYVIDTSVIYNMTGIRTHKSNLKSLARHYLGEDIQTNKDGHDSLEDSLAALKLTKLKLSKSVDFGDSVSSQNSTLYYNVLEYAKKHGRRTAIVSTKDITTHFDKFENIKFRTESRPSADKPEAVDYFEMSSNKLATKKLKEIASDFSFVVANLNIEPEQLQVLSVEKTISNVDKWISRVWKSVQRNGLFVVLLAGAEGVSDGVALIKAKENCNEI